MTLLTAREKNVCSYTGFFGLLIAVTCLIQNMAFFLQHWITYLLLFTFLLAISAFGLLIVQHRAAPILLIITSVLTAIGLLLLILNIVISPIVAILLVYTVVITSLVYGEGFPAKFRHKARVERAERDLWRDKI